MIGGHTMFIGFYSTANAVTLFGLLSSVMACFLAANGDYKFAVLLLGIACICDTVDGRIARSKGYRTPQQKCYGIQMGPENAANG